MLWHTSSVLGALEDVLVCSAIGAIRAGKAAAAAAAAAAAFFNRGVRLEVTESFLI